MRYFTVKKSTILRIVIFCAVSIGLCRSAITAPPAGESSGGKGVYQAMGAPSDPKVDARWNRFSDYAGATKLLKSLAAAHPRLAKLRSLGRSHGGREMWLLTVTNFKTGSDRHKPAFWIDGALHANEIQATEVTLYTAWYLLEMYGRNEYITRLLDQRTFYLLPMMSPDSRDAHMYRPNTTSSPRSGQIPVDDDRDGLLDEDGPDDLDGDGHITQMRLRDPNGRYKPHEKYPHIMVRAEADQPGEYRLLGSEGIDNDGDGMVNEDGNGFYDPNRDWPDGWQPAYVQYGSYRYPFSLRENRLVGDFVMDHRNIAGAQTYHNSGGMILHGPGNNLHLYDKRDIMVYDEIAKKGKLVLPGYRYLTTKDGLYTVYGAEMDWFYGMQGVLSYCNELFTRQNYFRQTPEKSRGGETTAAFDKYLLFGHGTVAWHEVDHPQYGKIEVGGQKKSWGRQPPSFLLEEECHRNMAFTLYHADQMPRVRVQSVEVKSMPGGLSQVTAVVANDKLTPTHTAQDLKNNITPPDVVSIEGKGLEVVVGLVSKEAFFRNAREQKWQAEKMRIGNVPGMGAVYVRWLLRGQGPYTIAVESLKGGRDRKQTSVAP